MAATLVPKNVSPFIRTCRWTFLLTGIAYGHFHYKSLEKKEVGIQIRENAIREKRDAKIAAEKGRAMKIEMDALAKEAGVVTSSVPGTPSPPGHH